MDGVRFGEPQVVARAGAGGQVVGMCLGPGPEQVTCTLVPHGVQVVDAATSTCVLSWSLKGRTPLVPAAVIGAGERLVLACEDGSVLSWRAQETTDLARADVLKTGKGRGAKLQMLLVEPSLEAVLLVYADGHVRMMCPDLSREMCNTTLGLPKDSEVIFADLARGGQSSYLAVVLTRGADGSTHACRWRVNTAADGSSSFSMSKARWDPLPPPAGGAKGEKQKGGVSAVLTCALHRPPPDSAGQPTLSVVWESLVWQRFRVGTGSSPTLDTTLHVSGVAPSPRLSAPARGKGAAPPATGVVACAIQSDYLIVIGRDAADTPGKAADKAANCNCLTAWDALYGTTQGAGPLRWSSDEENTAHYSAAGATSARATADGSLVAVALDKCVVVCRVQSRPMSLDMAVAAAAGARQSGRGQAAAALRPVDLMACIAMADDGSDQEGAGGAVVVTEGPRRRVAQAVEEGNSREEALLRQISSDTKSSKWVDAVKLYLEDLLAESVNAEAARRGSKPQVAVAGRRRGGGMSGSGSAAGGGAGSSGARGPVRVAVSDQVVDAVVRRCCLPGADSKYDEALLCLLQAGCVTLRAQPGLVQHAIDQGNLVLLEGLLKHVPDLLEEHLLACLKLILLSIRKQAMDTFITAWAAAAPETPVLDHDAVRRHLLDLVMLAPKDHWPLVRELKKLSLQEAVRLLRYCQSLYKMHGVAANVQPLKPHKGCRTPHLRCVVEWITAIMDAHFTALVLAPECHSLLKELKDLTRAETVLAKETLSLDGLLQHVLQKKPLPAKPMRHYAVENLYIP